MIILYLMIGVFVLSVVVLAWTTYRDFAEPMPD